MVFQTCFFFFFPLKQCSRMQREILFYYISDERFTENKEKKFLLPFCEGRKKKKYLISFFEGESNNQSERNTKSYFYFYIFSHCILVSCYIKLDIKTFQYVCKV